MTVNPGSWLFSLLAAISCSASQGPARLPIAPDHSLTPSEYVALGMPAHERLWTSDDYRQAALTLQSIANSDKTKLPRVHGIASAPVFARLVATENLEVACQFGDRPSQRFPYLVQLYPALLEPLKVYLQASNTGVAFDEELVEFMLFIVDASHRLATDADAVFASLSPNDPDYLTGSSGWTTMRSGLSSVVSGAIQTLTEKNVYRRTTLLRLTSGLREHLPALVTHLPDASRQEVPLRLARLIDKEADPELKAALQALLDAVNRDPAHGT